MPVKRTLPPLLIDLGLVLAALWLAFWLRFNLELPDEFAQLALESAPWVALGYVAGLLGAGVYRQVWRYTSLPDLRQLVTGVMLGAVGTAAIVLMLRLPSFPRSVLIIQPLVALVLLAAVRAIWRMAAERQEHAAAPGARALIVAGSLHDSTAALRALKGSTQWHPVAIVSPDRAERGRSIQDVAVLGSIDELAGVAARTGADAVLVASLPGSDARRELLQQATQARLSLLTLPHPDEWLQGGASGTGQGAPRRVELEDLLGRTPVQLDVRALSDLFAGRTVLVTGAGGSIGSELCRQIARFGVARLVCVDVSEYAVYRLELELRQAFPHLSCAYYTANVREPDRLAALFALHQPAAVFHAAAYKHVPLMEELNEIEALRTNVLGTMNVARAAGRAGVGRFVLVSTDKAVNPTNVMGASKRIAELVVQSVAREFPATRYVSVRFGNVLGSSGSVIPLFTEQIARGGPVTVTHPEIVRYFMTIPEAAQLVLQAGLMGDTGQIYVLDMGEPVKIVELARMLIRLSGKTEQDVPITFTGLRPGEKLYEELLADDETTLPTPHPKLRIARAGEGAAVLDAGEVAGWIGAAGGAPDARIVRDWIRQCVPEYRPA